MYLVFVRMLELSLVIQVFLVVSLVIRVPSVGRRYYFPLFVDPSAQVLPFQSVSSSLVLFAQVRPTSWTRRQKPANYGLLGFVFFSRLPVTFPLARSPPSPPPPHLRLPASFSSSFPVFSTPPTSPASLPSPPPSSSLFIA